MTMPMLPNVSLGNTESEISSAVGSFAKGLQAERARQRDEALSTALVHLQMVKAMQPNYEHIVVQTPNGPRHAFTDKKTLQTTLTDEAAADPQMAVPTEYDNGAWGLGMTPRNRQGPVTPAQFPAGTNARGPAPIPVPQETPSGPRTIMTPRTPHASGQANPNIQSSGRPVQPGQPTGHVPSVQGQPVAGNAHPQQPGIVTRATEADERRARAALDMVQGKYEMRQALESASQGRNPQEMRQNAQNVYDEVARYLASGQVGDNIPIVGHLIDEIVNQSQSALSPAAARYFSGFMHGAAARAFSNGGTALTRQEIEYSLASLAPKPFEDSSTTQMRDRLWNGVIAGATAGNNAWQRYRATAKQLGYDDSNVDLTAPAPVQQEINPLTGLPMGHRRNH